MVETRPNTYGPTGVVAFVGLEVETVTSDALRAQLRVSGALAPSCAPLLTSVLRTHLAAGRRFLRVDLAAARVEDAEVIDALVQARRSVTALGGLLVFENAGPRIVDAVRHATLNVRNEQLSSAS